MRRSLLILLGLALATAACSGSGGTSAITAPAATTVTDTLTGTVPFTNYVQPFGVDFKTFTVNQTGPLAVTLTAAGPPALIVMGLGLGTPGASSCSILPGDTTLAQASTTAQLSYGSLPAGSYCVQVFDVGSATAPITYSVTVSHT
jgi:hypothetical protein